MNFHWFSLKKQKREHLSLWTPEKPAISTKFYNFLADIPLENAELINFVHKPSSISASKSHITSSITPPSQLLGKGKLIIYQPSGK